MTSTQLLRLLLADIAAFPAQYRPPQAAMFAARAPFGVPYFHPPCDEAALPFGFALDEYQKQAEQQRAERRRDWLKRPMLLPPGSAEFNERESLALRLRLAAVSHQPMAKVGAEIALTQKVYSAELNHTQALLGAQHRDGAAAPGSVGARIGPAAQAVSQVCSFCLICFLHGVVTKLWGVRLR